MKLSLRFLTAAAGLALVAGFATQLPAAEPMVRAPAPRVDPRTAAPQETAVFAGGCFWGVQGVFSHVKGVTAAVSGYTGGRGPAGGYERVSTGATGHAEAVRVTFDPRQVSYGQLLQVYFSVVADPTQLNRQGPDHGTQYRSALFPTTPAQAAVARGYLAQLAQAKLWSRPIVTRIERPGPFFPAEGYHQNYLALNPTAGYIAANDMPKVEQLRAWYPGLWRDRPVLVRG